MNIQLIIAHIALLLDHKDRKFKVRALSATKQNLVRDLRDTGFIEYISDEDYPGMSLSKITHKGITTIELLKDTINKEVEK